MLIILNYNIKIPAGITDYEIVKAVPAMILIDEDQQRDKKQNSKLRLF